MKSKKKMLADELVQSTVNHDNNYEMLKRAGHSPAKASEILLDAKRGDKYAWLWIEAARSLVSMNTCNHIKGDGSWWLNDARDIPVGRVCGKCIKQVKQKFRPEIFRDSQYTTDEPIEPEDY